MSFPEDEATNDVQQQPVLSALSVATGSMRPRSKMRVRDRVIQTDPLPEGGDAQHVKAQGAAPVGRDRSAYGVSEGDSRVSKSLTSVLFRAARLSATGRAVRRGRVVRRARNIVVGRALRRVGFWRRLWRCV
jgi:hypothetical protein